MIPARIHHYREPAALLLGLKELGARGLTPRGLLFIALDPRGEITIAVPDDLGQVANIRIGDKLTLKTPWEGRYFNFDAIHRLPGGGVLWNGDRRMAEAGDASEAACAIAEWLRGCDARDVFLGCTPHQPGCWWVEGERSAVVDLHAQGLADAVVTASGLLARRAGEAALYYLDFAELRRHGPNRGWTPIYHSSLGNILMVERRVLNYSLVVTCERGIVELDTSGLPERIRPLCLVPIDAEVGIVGRIDGGAFAVTTGRAEPWGLADVTPALLVGTPNASLVELPAALATPPYVAAPASAPATGRSAS